MRQAIVVGAIVVAACNVIPALLGTWRWYRGDDSLRWFWPAVRAGQGAALVFVVAVGAAVAAGRGSSYSLFYLYALLPVAIAFVAEQLRVASAQVILDRRDLADSSAVGELTEADQRKVVSAIIAREMGIMTLAGWVVVFLALRAASTAHGF